MFGLIKKLFKGFLMFGFPLLMALCAWIILEPATFWQNIVALFLSIVVYFTSLIAVSLILNELI